MAITKLHSHIINLMMHGSSLIIKDSNSLSYMKTTANIFQSLFSFCYCLWKFFSVYIFIIWPNLQLFYTTSSVFFVVVEKLSTIKSGKYSMYFFLSGIYDVCIAVV